MSEELALNDDQIGEPAAEPAKPRKPLARRSAAADGVARDPRHLLAGARGARLPQLHRQALLHPVRIDAAGAAGRRPAGRHQISLWLVVHLASPSPTRSRSWKDLVLQAAAGKLGRAIAVREGPAVRPPARARRRRHRHPAGAQPGLYQARHRPARRPDRGARRRRPDQQCAGQARADALCR